MIENTNTKQFYPGPILNDTLEINEFLFNTAEQVKIKHSKFDENGVLRDIDLEYGYDYEVVKDEALTCEDDEMPSHAHIAEMALTASTGQITLKEHVTVLTGERLTAYRESAIIQDKNYPRTGAFPAAAHEGALDYLTMQNQEQQDELDRALKVPISTQNFAGSMPLPIPGRALKINQDGSGFEMSVFDPDIALTTTENFRNEAQQFATEAEHSAQAAQNSATVAGNRVTEINTLYQNYSEDITEVSTNYITQIDSQSKNYISQITSKSDKILKDADAIINRVGLNMFDLVLKDHLLSYPNDQGLALQGTWVYRDAVAGSRYGYPDFYNTCLAEYNNATSTTLHLATNVTKYGRITESNGVISNFTHACNYAAMKVKSPTKSFELVIKTKTPATLSNNSVIQANEQHKGLILRAMSTTSTKCWLSSNGTSWNICDGFETNLDLPANTNVWLRIKWTGTEYTFEMSTDNKTWTKGTSKASNLPIYWDTGLQGLGGCHWEAYAWVGGSIDLNNSYLDIDGARYWDGTIKLPCKKHSNGHVFYHIGQKTKVDAAYNLTKSAWFYGIDPNNYRIFLPRHEWFEQLTTNTAEMNKVVEAGIPNITGFFPSELHGSAQSFTGGAIYNPGQTLSGSAGEGTDWRTNLDASRQSFVFGNSPTVQPPAIKRLAYICVGNQVQDNSWVDVVTQVRNGAKEIDDQVRSGLTALSSASTGLNYNRIAAGGGIVKQPQRLKLKLENSRLTLGAGSIVTVPTDTNSVKYVTTTKDLSITFSNRGGIDTIYMNANGNSIVMAGVQSSLSAAPTDTKMWYDRSTGTITKYNSGIPDGANYSFPLCQVINNGTIATGIKYIFDGIGFMGSLLWLDKDVTFACVRGVALDGTNNFELRTTTKCSRALLERASYKTSHLFLTSSLNLYNTASNNPVYSQDYDPYSDEEYYIWNDTRGNQITGFRNYRASTISYEAFLGTMSYTNQVITEWDLHKPLQLAGVNSVQPILSNANTVTELCAPDYSKMITVSTATKPDGNFTAPANGYMIFDIVLWSDAGHITINGQDICRRIHGSDYMTDYSLTVPVAKGDYITFYSVYNDTASYTSHTVKFVPMKGAK